MDVKLCERVPKVPDMLDDEAVACWKETAKRLINLRVLAETDLRTLTRYCRMWSRWVALPDDEDDKLLKYDTALLKIEAHFGLTPSTRSRLPLTKGQNEEPDDPASKFVNLRVS